ncbi:hypothetical protein [Methanosphaerula palustris]|uniref:Uncharacterized protein n=1 Tax=Methanosphaerula palustris (strain ATCC BAA-1556 / DSM 19958 / E1-9c) TaxID=521011 RepID=B8GE55_METPE|nr:hypothetical protein [Methanosphaerula palustris]ACL17556.1 hypothetical protein Mpal_2267 [Methanosphaerula palustris E1-9c]
MICKGTAWSAGHQVRTQGVYAVDSWFRQQGYLMVRTRQGTRPLDLLAGLAEELVLMKGQSNEKGATITSCDRGLLQRREPDSPQPPGSGRIPLFVPVLALDLLPRLAGL